MENKLISDIKDMDAAIKGISYASMGVKPSKEYTDNEDFAFGYNFALDMQRRASARARVKYANQKRGKKM